MKVNKKEKLYREFLNIGQPKIEGREVSFPVSSETPVERSFGDEILIHEERAIDLQRLENSAPLLLDHDHQKVVGKVVSNWLEGKRLWVKVKISRSEMGEVLLKDIIDGIRDNVSIGYRISEVEENTPGKVEVSRWMPFEVSFVGVPADHTVGVGRSDEEEKPDKVELAEVEEVKEEKREIPEEKTEEIKQKTENIKERSKTMDEPKIEVKENQIDVLKKERSRVAEITAMGKEFDCRELAEGAICNDVTIDAFREQVLRDVVKAKAIVDPNPNIGMDDKEIREFSMFRAINAIMAGNWDGAGLEREASIATAEKLGKNFSEKGNSFFLPHDVQSKRGFDASGKVQVRTNEWIAGTDAKGGYTVATEVAPMIDLLRNALFAQRAGATMLTGLVGNLQFPRHSSNTWSSWWVSEATSASQNYPTLDQFTLSPKEIAAYSDVSTLLMKQSNEAIEAYIQRHLAMDLAVGIDTAVLKGGSTGGSSGAPTKGLLNTTLGINSVDFGSSTAASSPTWAKIVQMETEVGADNAIMPDSRLGYLVNSRVKGKLKTTLQSSYASTPGWLMAADGSVNGYPAYETNIMPNSSIIFGDMRQIIIGMWGGTEILVDQYSQSASRLVRLVASQAVDYNWEHVEAFCKGNYVLST